MTTKKYATRYFSSFYKAQNISRFFDANSCAIQKTLSATLLAEPAPSKRRLLSIAIVFALFESNKTMAQ